MIKLYKEKDDWKNATNYLKIYFKVNNKKDNRRLGLYRIQESRILDKNKDYKDSRKLLEQAFDLDNQLFICYYFLGNSFAKESNQVYDNAVEIEKNIEGSLEKDEQSQKLKLEAENILSKAIPMWSYFIENMPDYSWMILPTLKDALQALNRYDDIEKILIQSNKSNSNVDFLFHLADFYANE